MRYVNTIALGASAVCVAFGAHASIIGDSLDLAYCFPSLCGSLASYNVIPDDPFTAALGDDVLLVVDAIPVEVGFSNPMTLTFRFEDDVAWTDVPYSGPVLTDLTGPNFGRITSVTGLAAVDVSVSPSTLVLGSQQLDVNWEGRSFNSGDMISITFGGGVPEPATWAMMTLGVIAIGGAIRSTRRNMTTA